MATAAVSVVAVSLNARAVVSLPPSNTLPYAQFSFLLRSWSVRSRPALISFLSHTYQLVLWCQTPATPFQRKRRLYGIAWSSLSSQLLASESMICMTPTLPL